MRNRLFAVCIIALLAVASAMPILASARQDEAQLTIIELKVNGKPGGGNVIPPEDNGDTNSHYSLLRFHWFSTAKFWVNPTNNYGFGETQVVSMVQKATYTWDVETKADVFSYQDTTSRTAGTKDDFNVVDWGTYSSANVIAVTYIWSVGRQIVETDLRMNTRWSWSLSGESGKMDTQNILTHEFGHWAGLNDLYKNADYWLTMYGYSNYGITYQRTLGSGDINGLQAFYGPA